MNDPSQRFALLRAGYAKSLASKHAALAHAWHAFAAAADETSGRELRTLVHRLAGSAPPYGYAALGELASAIDGEFTCWEEVPPSTRASARDLVQRISAPMQALLDSLARSAEAAAQSTD